MFQLAVYMNIENTYYARQQRPSWTIPRAKKNDAAKFVIEMFCSVPQSYPRIPYQIGQQLLHYAHA